MCEICGECDNYFAITLGVFKNHGICRLSEAVVHEEDPSCPDFEEKQGGE